MVRAARARGHLPARWVTGDAVYGGNPAFRDALDGDGLWSLLEVPVTTGVCPVTGPAPTTPVASGGWRRREDLGRPTTVGDLAAGLADRWQTLTIGLGAHGPRTYQFASQRVRDVRAGVLGGELTAVFRRNLDGSELKLYLTNAPPGVPLLLLGQVASRRWDDRALLRADANGDRPRRVRSPWVARLASSHRPCPAGRPLPFPARWGSGGN